jgi:hypothetical protein
MLASGPLRPGHGDKPGHIRHGAESGITAIGFVDGDAPGDVLQLVPIGKF